MDKIKIYQNVNREKPEVSFSISRMGDVYDKHKGKVDEPHRHDFFTVILVNKSAGQHIIDFNAYELGEKQVFFISPGQVHQVIEHERSDGYAMVFSNAFLVENNIERNFIDNLNLFYDYGQSPPLIISDEQQQNLIDLAEAIIKTFHSNQSFQSQTIGAYLKIFLIHCNNACTQNERGPHEIEAGNSSLKKFKLLVDQHYKEWHGTADYAAAMHISPDHLNRTIKSLIGKTAKEYIQSRIIIAAKRLIFFTDKSAKEIGYELGFSEASHFSAFFKKETGSSPIQFKNLK